MQGVPMWLMPLLLVLAAAGLHAGWNLIVKGEDDKLFSGWLTVLTPGVLLSPALLFTGPPPRDVWPIILASGVLESLYMVALTRAYTYGDLSVVYPVARGLAPLFVAVGAPIALGEHLSPLGMLAILLVGGGIAGLGLSARRSATTTAALFWAVTTAALIASYSMVDKVGVSRSHPLAYVISIFGCTGIILTPYVLQQRGLRRVVSLWRLRWGILVAGGFLSLGAYLLVLIAMRLTQVSYTAALIASYSMVDKVGVSRSNPFAYVITIFGCTGLLLTPYILHQRGLRRVAGLWRSRWSILVTGGLLSLGAYLLVLLAMRLTQVSYTAALRESSVIIATVLGWRVLKEPYGRTRLLASAVVALGLILLVLAMRG